MPKLLPKSLLGELPYAVGAAIKKIATCIKLYLKIHGFFIPSDKVHNIEHQEFETTFLIQTSLHAEIGTLSLLEWTLGEGCCLVEGIFNSHPSLYPFRHPSFICNDQKRLQPLPGATLEAHHPWLRFRREIKLDILHMFQDSFFFPPLRWTLIGCIKKI